MKDDLIKNPISAWEYNQHKVRSTFAAYILNEQRAKYFLKNAKSLLFENI